MATLDDLLSKTTPEMRLVVHALRKTITDALPDVIETVDLPDGLLAYGTGGRMRDLVVGIIAHTAHVNVQFLDGVDLPDPNALLEGTGKRIRHVKNRTPADADRPALRALIIAQWGLHQARH